MKRPAYRIDNQKISPEQLAKIRVLDDFDLTMVLSEIHDNGWPVAAGTLELAFAATLQTTTMADAEAEIRLNALRKVGALLKGGR
jgi:hypothetical protein